EGGCSRAGQRAEGRGGVQVVKARDDVQNPALTLRLPVPASHRHRFSLPPTPPVRRPPMRFPPGPAHALPKPSFWAGIPQRSADIIGTTYTPPSSNPEPERSRHFVCLQWVESVLPAITALRAHKRFLLHCLVCRQTISDSLLGNLRECLAHLV